MQFLLTGSISTFPVALEDSWRVVAGITIDKFARTDVVNGIEDGDKHTVNRLLAEQFIRFGHTLARRDALQSYRAYQRAADSHEDSGGDALATHIGYHYSDAVVVDAEEIVEVASDILGGSHAGSEFHFGIILREWREDTRQDSLLYLCSYRQICLQRLQLVVLLL